MPATIPDDIAKALAAGGPAPAGLSADEQYAWDQLDFFYKHGLGYANEMANRPQTLYALADSPVGLAAWMLDHDARSYAAHRARLRRAAGGPDARRHPRQRHALLADEHGGLVGASLLGEQARLLRAEGRHDPDGGERLPGRDLRRAAELDGEGVSQPHPLQPAAQGDALRGVGTATVFQRRAAGGVQVVALVGAPDLTP